MKPKSLSIVTFIAAMALAALAAPMAHAQATRTWVSGVGDDANPCSRTAPCKTFAGAISQTAAGGEISVLDPGGFGALTITKSITINGEGTLASILVSGTNGLVVAAAATDTVIIRNISIDGLNGSGLNGIELLTGGKLLVENVAIFGFSGQGILFEPSSGASSLSVSNSSVRSSGGGIYVTGGGTSSVALNGVVIAGNNRGLRADDGANVVVSGSTFVNNAGNAIVAGAVSRAVSVSLDGCSISNSAGSGITANAMSTVRISNDIVTGNSTGLQAAGGSIVSFGNNRVQGNTTNGAPTSTIGQI